MLAFIAIPLVSAAAWLLLFNQIYGTFDPRAPYGGSPEMRLARIPIGLTGLFIDQQFGLLPNAPVYLDRAELVRLIRTAAASPRHRDARDRHALRDRRGRVSHVVGRLELSRPLPRPRAAADGCADGCVLAAAGKRRWSSRDVGARGR